jgi:hypothetical protein
MNINLKYWNNEYSLKRIPTIPSQFAAFVANELKNDEINIIDIGCGNARDSVFFAGLNKIVLGLDGSETVINENIKKYYDMDKVLKFSHLNLNDDKSVDFLLPKKCAIYCRFFIHAIDEKAEKNLFTLLNRNLLVGQRIFLEFRTEDDADKLKMAEKHYRRYIKAAEFLKKLNENKFKIEYSIIGKGFAKYQSEDAHVCRIIAVKDLS